MTNDYFNLTEDDVLELITRKLYINIKSFNDWYDSGIEVSIHLGHEEISSSRVSIEKCKCKCSDSNPW